ncbi:MAG: hypothetical protein WC254_06275 [Candidatus Woesearchaeota archaeon]|jgi:hypothetical protein
MSVIHKVYLKGKFSGLYGAGAIVVAARNEDSEIVKGRYYRIDEVVATDVGACGKNLLVKLEGVEGMYSKTTFRVDGECMDRMRSDS